MMRTASIRHGDLPCLPHVSLRDTGFQSSLEVLQVYDPVPAVLGALSHRPAVKRGEPGVCRRA